MNVLEKTGPPDSYTPAQSASFLKAALEGDLAKIRALLKDNPDLVFSKNDNGIGPLHEAAKEGHRDVAELLLANKADVNARNDNGYTPLHYATEHGHAGVVELLLANKADVHAKERYGNKTTPLHYAALNGHEDVVELLLANKADVNSKDDDRGWTPLHYAAFNGHEDVVELLLATNADVNAKHNLGWTPLDEAADEGHEDVAELLRQHGGQQRPTQSAAKNEDDGLPFEALVEELVALCQAGYNWAQQNRFPETRYYPQYSRVRRLGDLIHARVGFRGMQQACDILRGRVVTRDGVGQYLAEDSWEGIGGWLP